MQGDLQEGMLLGMGLFLLLERLNGSVGVRNALFLVQPGLPQLTHLICIGQCQKTDDQTRSTSYGIQPGPMKISGNT